MAKPHEVLGISPDANFFEARAAYKRLVQVYHPDKPTGDMARFNAVQAAYNVLRTKYEATGVFDDLIDLAVKENKA